MNRRSLLGPLKSLDLSTDLPILDQDCSEFAVHAFIGLPRILRKRAQP